ncbi:MULTISPECIES: 3-hydroxyacyl-CoA dehydrogenase NAD-binding domain-containing protein [Caballeronia]|jgi:3-hydroxyacyl-CoA dehydrogenase|uniref:3-hydroxyacyl-CoA dehydrogenase n=1 Tax=Caballeronia zhejiangensis TaxID=871203 RepID=A0A656QUS8_9BURK|nr:MULTISPECIES: 3-hydroxyacyl-CoA dehydrogenase NAD-binding domain-containing protein [Caballeronia]EKS71192.1 3-hydroxyacyl-CoA dehydrogenase [Burkholderia sp. SJ98]KDR34211.1 3-hydroxyacyl-CoA dehydrogenase [Caballeronia zhejiangensis]MDR5788416.1 3-hydroxyacyl-CoA dehydrogenase NAD-binding domain-containing protein [Caballeronia sp. LP003]
MTLSSAPETASAVQHELRGSVLVVTIDHAPVNALNAAVRRGLIDAIEAADADASVRAVLIVGAGRNFIAGADIREFGKPAVPPSLPEVCNRIERCEKPVVAAIHGAALGGGLEVALASHYRIAVAGAKLGLPEVQLGLLPGAGGTQRSARLIGAQAALSMMLSGHHIGAEEALRLGLVDRVGQSDDVFAEGLAFAHELIATKAAPRRTKNARGLADKEASVAAIAAARAETQKKSRGLLSPLKIVDCVEAALNLPFDEGLRFEREQFLECRESPQRAGLVHAFFVERETQKSPETRDAQPRALDRIGVIGGGTMGAGIAVALLDAGLAVTMIERDEASLERGSAHVEKVYDALIAKGRLTHESKTRALQRFHGDTKYDALADADLVIEAVFEDMAAKKAVFAQLDRVCKPGAVLATNTSYLDIDEIAASISRPQDVLGLHFFSPANIMKLLEVVVPARVSADVVATGFELAKKLKKVAVRAGVCDGFIGNRMLAVYRAAADHLMEDGASPYQIDRAVRDFGFPMGPYQVIDLAGGDIGWAARKRRAATRDPNARYVRIGDELCERGWFGQKTGRGFYRYEDGARTGTPDAEVESIIDAERERAGVKPRPFTDEQIVRRYLAAMINEGANIVHEGIAQRPLDVDATLMHGFGFPRYRGGPMHYADTVGLDNVLADIRAFAQEDPLFWRASPLIVDLVARGRNFASLNQTA